MNFDKLIQYKALDRQYSMSGVMPDMLIEGLPAEEKKKHLRNVCALINIELFDNLEHTCSILGLTKRQFIEASIGECLKKAEPLVTETEEAFADAYQAAQQHEAA